MASPEMPNGDPLDRFRHHRLIFSCTCVFQVFVDATCSDGSECPSHLPYCTPAGCSFTCPDNTWINGTNCVLDCGNYYIFNKECVMKCPKTHAFVRRHITVRQSAFIALQFCMEKCPDKTFNFDQQCLDACPSSDIYAYNNTCVKYCPTSDMFYRNNTKDGIVVALECISECRGTHPVRYGQTCLTSCIPPLYVYQNECIEECPDNANKIFQSYYFGYRANFCDSVCPYGKYSINRTCVDACPSNYSVFNSSVCVDVCPEGSPYIFSNTEFQGTSRNTCVADCHPYLIHKNQCVSHCPEATVLVNNAACEDECPSSAPNICNEKKVVHCRNSSSSYNLYMQKCMLTCPEFTFIDNNYCVSNCEGNAKLFNSTCVKSCPIDYPYQFHDYLYTYPILKCVRTCPKHTYLMDNICVQECTNGQYLLERNSTCINDCPLRSYVRLGKNCLDRCPEQWFNQSGNCVDDCLSELAFNNTCVTECPSTYSLLQQTDLWPNSRTHICVMQCSEHSFKYNAKCVKQCELMIGPNNTCVSQCPESYPYRKGQSERKCVSKCENNKVVLNGTCIPFSDCKLEVIFNGTCLYQCPPGYYWANSKIPALVSDEVCFRKYTMWIRLIYWVSGCIIIALFWRGCTAAFHKRYVSGRFHCVGILNVIKVSNQSMSRYKFF